MGPDEMFEGSQQPFAYKQGRSSTVPRNKTTISFFSPGLRATQKRHNMFTVPAWLQLETVVLTVCLGGELPGCPSASAHLLTHRVTHDHTGLPSSQRPTQLAFFFLLLWSFAGLLHRDKVVSKMRGYNSHFRHTSTINLLSDNVPLLLSVIAVAALTHFKTSR